MGRSVRPRERGVILQGDRMVIGLPSLRASVGAMPIAPSVNASMCATMASSRRELDACHG